MTGHPKPWFRTKYGILLIITPIVVGAFTLGFITWRNQILDENDRAALEDAARLGRGLKRLCDEMTDLGCAEPFPPLSDENLIHMVGPYYGVSTSSRSNVVARVVGPEVWVCSRWGRPLGADGEERTIYRVTRCGTALPSVIAPCEGIECGRLGQYAYTISIVRFEDDKCSFRKPGASDGVPSIPMFR